MSVAFCLALLLSAEPNAEQLELLKTFRSEFVAITPGTGEFPRSFDMGRASHESNSQPVHKVTFNYSFSVAKYEVPQNLWQAVMGTNPSKWKGPRNSVEMLSVDEARLFCRKATEMLRTAKLIKPNEIIRLPSEAEWEYCARAGTTHVYSFGDDASKLSEFAWFTGNAAGNDPPVGAKKPNPWQLYDVHGYLYEWCEDSWHDTYKGAPTDGSAWLEKSSEHGVVRSGSWKDGPQKLTSTFRGQVLTKLRDDAVGLRCVLAEGK